jgi:hypothetical protein
MKTHLQGTTMYRPLAIAVIAGVTAFLAACEPVTSLKHPRWERPDYTTTHSDAYYQHDPLRHPGPSGGP